MITYINPDSIEDQSIDWSKLKNIPEFTPLSDHVIGKGDAENSAVLKGGNNTVTGNYSAAIGYGNTVENDSSVAFGYNNKVKAVFDRKKKQAAPVGSGTEFENVRMYT